MTLFGSSEGIEISLWGGSSVRKGLFNRMMLRKIIRNRSLLLLLVLYFS